ncbi:HAD family hydrolase [Mesorhizobium xinjiangense]|uniref:HAD family hydrolase n=1 Tax=Mesorhizobium xinjiangense TaxID=2678685 RepID=UPI0012EDC307|nr:HAD family hydrolase [Mesorhizobium xinjiangense]
MQPQLVIFDCDGVLVDSEIIAARVEASLITAAGFEISAEEIASNYAGLTFRDILLRLEAEAQIPFQANLIDKAETAVDERLKREVRMIDGAGQAVLSVQGPRCICSNSTPERLDAMLTRTGLKSLFGEHVFSSAATPSKRPKPAPDVFLYAAEKMGAEPAETFVVEDSVHGIAGAKAAGMRVIGFTGGSHTYPGHADRLTEAGAETVINRWSDFASVIAALSEFGDII